MPVKKTYTAAEAQAAMDTANDHYYGHLLRVRNDVTNDEMNGFKAKGSGPNRFKGRGVATGHANVHVDGTKAQDDKSIFVNDSDQANAVAILLNSADGQKALGRLDASNPNGDETGFDGKFTAREDITGPVGSKKLFGYASNSSHKRRVKTAVCVIQKIGPSNLWVHTAYPKWFY